MISYITAFIFYTMAMVGILLLGFVVYKKAILPSKQESKGMIKIIDKTMISPKKSLMVVKVKNEKFLIALDADKTTFLSKLADEKQVNQKEERTFQEQQKQMYIDDIELRRLNNIQKQLKQLYHDNQQEERIPQTQQKQVYMDDFQQQKLDRIQKQFKQLYSNNQEEVKSDQQPNRKEMIRRLLKDLNDATGAVKTGSY